MGGISADAQLPGGGMQMMSGMEKLFGDNQTFSATLHIQANTGNNPVNMSGKMVCDNGNTRFEMDLSQLQGGNLPPEMKAMGLDKIIVISQKDGKTAYMIYPNAQAYTVVPGAPDNANINTNLQITPLGNETVQGHPCVKNRAVFIDKQGISREFTVWNATDLNNFPVQISPTREDNPIIISFQNISFDKPAASQFNPPSGYAKYNSTQEMMQFIMMKNIGNAVGGFGPPPQQ